MDQEAAMTRARLLHADSSQPLNYTDCSFEKMVSDGETIVDKSMLIRESWMEPGTPILLRPRRFGKSLNLTMLQYFCQKMPPGYETFKKMRIGAFPEMLERHMGKYPVVHLSLQTMKIISLDLEDLEQQLKGSIWRHGNEQTHLARAIFATKKKYVYATFVEEMQIARQLPWHSLLQSLMTSLCGLYGEHAVVLIDEYDAIHQKAAQFIVDEDVEEKKAQQFLKKVDVIIAALFASTTKETWLCRKAFLTGILPLAKTSSSSGLNNADCFDVTCSLFQDHFGFTEEEVSLLHQRKKELRITMEELKTNYNSYTIGNASLYNPYTVVHAINRDKIDWYWNASSLLYSPRLAELLLNIYTVSNRMLKKIIWCDITNLIELLQIVGAIRHKNGTFVKTNTWDELQESWVTFDWADVLLGRASAAGLARVLRDQGYLTTSSNEMGLKVPNAEVQRAWDKMLDAPGNAASVIAAFDVINSLFAGDLEKSKEAWEEFLGYFSPRQIATKDIPCEEVYHLLFCCLCVAVRGKHDYES